MKFTTQLIKDLKYVKGSAAYFIASFIIAPIVIGLLFGTMYSKMMNKEIKFNQSDICIEYKENSKYTKSIEEIIGASGMKFINIKDREKLEEVENSSYLLIEENDGSLTIHNYGKSSMEKNIITSMISEYMNVLYRKGSEKMSSEERGEFMKSYLNSSMKDYTKTREVEIGKKLNSYQTMIINLFIAMSLFLAVTFASEFIRSREDSVLKRLISMNKDSKGIYINSTASVFVITFMITLIYLMFAGNIVLKMELTAVAILVSATLQALIITAIFGISIAVFKREQTFKNSITPVMMIMMILGGSTFPVDMFDNIIILTKLMPNYNIQRVFFNLAVGNGIENIMASMGIILIETAVVLTVGMIAFKAGEGRMKNVKYSDSKLEKNVEGF